MGTVPIVLAAPPDDFCKNTNKNRPEVRAMIFNTLREERPKKQPSDFVEIQLRIPKWELMQTIEDVLYNP